MTILLPVDGSPICLAAVGQALALLHAPVPVTSVREPSSTEA